MGGSWMRACWAASLLALAGTSPALAAEPSARISRVGPAPASQPLELVLSLKADLAGLRREALAVSSLGSPRYGDYSSIAQLARRYGARSHTRAQVLSYLRSVGAHHVRIDATGLFAEASMSAALAARVFDTPLAQFRTARGARFVAPAVDASAVAEDPRHPGRGSAGPGGATGSARRLPAALRAAVTGVVGLDARPVVAGPGFAQASGRRVRASRSGVLAHAASQPSSGAQRSGTPSGCGSALDSGGFTPNQYLTAYGYERLHAAGVDGAGQRVALIEIDGFTVSDINSFAACFGLRRPAINTFTVGLPEPLAPGGESTLDLEVLDAAAPGLQSIDVFEAGSRAADALEALTAPLGTRDKPRVISVSFGICEHALQQAVGANAILSSEAALEMATASGVTLLAASGDQGSASCTGPDGAPIRLKSVSYPASSWWVTGVGGTNFVLNPTNQIISQLVWNDGADQPGSAGGGGTSILFKRPDYQNGISGATDRAIPDVSMLADIVPGYAIYCSVVHACIATPGSSPWVGIGGTSAATPLLAGGAALVDEQLRASHRRPLGLANPLLYRTSRSPAAVSIFFDVTAIGNDVGPDIPGNGEPLGCCTAGVGYDQASGLGSVNIATFAAAALASEPAIVTVGLTLAPHQQPIRVHELRATVSCSGPCLIGAYATVSVGRSSPFRVDSGVFRLTGPGSRTIPIRLSTSVLRRLRSGRAAHKPIKATIHGVLIDPVSYGVLPSGRGSIEQQTRGGSLAITG